MCPNYLEESRKVSVQKYEKVVTDTFYGKDGNMYGMVLYHTLFSLSRGGIIPLCYFSLLLLSAPGLQKEHKVYFSCRINVGIEIFPEGARLFPKIPSRSLNKWNHKTKSVHLILHQLTTNQPCLEEEKEAKA